MDDDVPPPLPERTPESFIVLGENGEPNQLTEYSCINGKKSGDRCVCQPFQDNFAIQEVFRKTKSIFMFYFL